MKTFILILATLLFACGRKETGSASFSTIVSALNINAEGTTSFAAANWRNNNRGAFLTSTSGQQISFSPSSMKINLKGVYLCQDIVAQEDELGCGLHQKVLEARGDNETELVGQNNFSELARFEASVEEDYFDSYRGVVLIHDGKAVISGEAAFKGVTYKAENLAVRLGGSGIALGLARPLVISEDRKSTLKLFFNTNKSLFIAGSEVSSNSGKIENPTAWVIADNVYVTPFDEPENPVVETYTIQLNSTEFGAKSNLLLRIMILLESANNLVGASWVSVYNGYDRASGNWDPCQLDGSLIEKNSDGSYLFSSSRNEKACPSARQLSFDSFDLSTHQGKLIYGSKTYDYSAVKK